MSKFCWLALAIGAFVVLAGPSMSAAAGRVVLMEQATNVGCG